MKKIVAKIGDWVNPIAMWVKGHRRDLWVALCIGLVGWSAYNVGLTRGQQLQPANGLDMAQEGSRSPTPAPKTLTVRQSAAKPVIRTDQRVVASKSSSSKKYHHTWCSGATKIKEANQVWFDNAELAEAAGYTLAGNCKP